MSKSWVRFAAFAFIVINLLVGLWGWSVRPQPQSSIPPGGSSIGQVILLRELAVEEQARLQLSLQTEQARDRALQNFQEFDLDGEQLAEGGCYIYSFPERDRLQMFLQRVQAVLPNAYLGENLTQQPGAVMLYIAPLPSFRLAQIEMTELRAAGVDGFIIADGELTNGISVGVFNAEQNIQQRISQLEALGYELERYQYMVDRSLYAVNIPVLSQARVMPQVWAEIRRDFPQMTSQQNSCWEVASTLNFN